MTGPTVTPPAPEPKSPTIKCPGCGADIDRATGGATFQRDNAPNLPDPDSPAGRTIADLSRRIVILEEAIAKQGHEAPAASSRTAYVTNRYFRRGGSKP